LDKEIATDMKSESLFLKCDSCSALNNKSLTCCSKCGSKLKNSRKKLYISLAGVVVVFLFIISSHDNQSKIETPSVSNSSQKEFNPEIPNAEAGLISLSEQIREQYASAKNELQKSVLRDQRKNQLANLGLTRVSNWVGTISKLDTNSDGKGMLVIKLSPKLTLATWNNDFSDMQDDTLIEKGTKVYSSLINMSVGQKVMFSGTFFPSEQDAVKEKSMTINGSLSEPEFLFRFDSIKPI